MLSNTRTAEADQSEVPQSLAFFFFHQQMKVGVCLRKVIRIRSKCNLTSPENISCFQKVSNSEASCVAIELDLGLADNSVVQT